MELGIDGLGTQRQQLVRPRPSAAHDERLRRHRPARGGRAGGRAARSPAPGEVVVDVAPRRASAAPTSSSSPARWPTCTTGTRTFPLRLGHEWMRHRSARSATASTPSWLGRRVTGDTMLGCGRCRRCRPGASTCATTAPRSASAAAGRVRSPSSCSCRPPRCTRCPTRSTTRPVRWSSPAATRCARCEAAGRRSGRAHPRLGPGTIGLLAAMFARVATASRCTSPAQPARSLDFARSSACAARGPWTTIARAAVRRGHRRTFDAPTLPARAVDAGRARRAGRATSGSSGAPSLRRHPRRWCSRTSPRSASSAPRPGLAGTIEHYADGARRPASARGRAPWASPTSARRSPASRSAGVGRRPQDPRRPAPVSSQETRHERLRRPRRAGHRRGERHRRLRSRGCSPRAARGWRCSTATPRTRRTPRSRSPATSPTRAAVDAAVAEVVARRSVGSTCVVNNAGIGAHGRRRARTTTTSGTACSTSTSSGWPASRARRCRTCVGPGALRSC